MSDFWFRLTHPSFWFQNVPSDPTVDKLLNDAMDTGADVKSDESCYWVTIEGLDVWVRNYPYNYGYIKGLPEVLPYPLTRVRLRRYVMQKLAQRIKRRES